MYLLIFSKRTVSPQTVEAFSKALHQFKQSSECRAIFQRGVPDMAGGGSC